MSALLRALAAPDPAVERVALAIATDAYPGLDVAAYRKRLDDFAAPLLRFGGASADARLEALVAHVYGELKFAGNESDYYDPRNSYLNEVIERRKGIPISLAVLLMAVGARIGLQVEGIGFPGHFLVRVGGDGGAYIDPFNDGRRIARAELLQLARRFLGNPEAHVAEAQLKPVDVSLMAVRMLYNLQQIYERRADHARALVVCDRLVDISNAPFHVRDRGMHAFALGSKEAATADLRRYLELSPDADDVAHVTQLAQQASLAGTSSRTLN